MYPIGFNTQKGTQFPVAARVPPWFVRCNTTIPLQVPGFDLLLSTENWGRGWLIRSRNSDASDGRNLAKKRIDSTDGKAVDRLGSTCMENATSGNAPASLKG